MTLMSPDPCGCPIQEIGPSMVGACPGGSILLFMTILEQFIFGRCDLADPCNRVKSVEATDENYDFVVIGGGTSGSVVAGRLSENPQWKVLLIEAGGDEPTPSQVPAFVTAYWGRNDTDWNYHTEKQERACLEDEGVCYWPRSKMLGGCTVINGMMYMRGHKEDYDSWASGGAKGWAWKDVFPYFLKSEDNKQIGSLVSSQYHNTGGPLPVQQFSHAPKFAHDVVSAAIEMGFPPTTDLNGDNVLGFTIAQTMNLKGSRFSAARAFLRPASHRKNLHVLLNTHVSRVIVDPLLKKVIAVEYLKDGETKQVGVNKETIISAGTINTPQILMLSGIGPKETLDSYNIPTMKDLPGVGQNLQNHVGVSLDFTLTKEADVPQMNWAAAMEYMVNREGPLSSTGMSQLTGMATSRLAPGSKYPDIQYFFNGYYSMCGTSDVQYDNDIDDKRHVGISAVNLQPKSRGFITLRSVDPLQPPLLQPNYFYDPRDLHVLIDAVRIAYKLANTTIMREKYGMTPTEGHGSECGEGGWEPSDDFLKCLARRHTAPENHQVGTAKIGAESDPMAVVDSELKVYGISGLRVADASVMPNVVTGNTAAASIMIGERAAEFITIRHQRSKTQGQGLGNRFGTEDNASGNYASQEDQDKWNYGSYESNEAKDDKLTDNQGSRPSHWHTWKPGGYQWGRGPQQWNKQPQDFHSNWPKHSQLNQGQEPQEYRSNWPAKTQDNQGQQQWDKKPEEYSIFPSKTTQQDQQHQWDKQPQEYHSNWPTKTGQDHGQEQWAKPQEYANGPTKTTQQNQQYSYR